MTARDDLYDAAADDDVCDCCPDGATEINARIDAYRAEVLLEAAIEEHGALMSGGGVHVWPDDPEILDIYPLAKRIEHGKRHGGTVLRRRVIVVNSWEEI